MTSLQKQLAAIAASSTHQLDLKAQKVAHGKSLLFEPKVAASQSFDSIYLICYEGYQDLCALDPRFLPFSKTLFSEQSKDEDRTQMTKKENKDLDAVLEKFITLVGPRLLLKPAEKALEWLVRRFRVHEYNTECLVLTYLPYHATPQFLALLSVLPPNPPPTLRFLFPYISPPTNVPRQAIVYTAANTPAFFSALQNYVVRVLQARHQGPKLLGFWSGITTQAVDAVLEQSHTGRKEVRDERTEKLVLRVIPALNECLKLSDVPEAVTGCYMIIIILATKGGFEDKILDALMEAVIRSQSPETLEECLVCLAVIAEERSQHILPGKVARRLLRLPKVAQTLASLSTRCRVQRLALGGALGVLEALGRSSQSLEARGVLEELLTLQVLDDAHLTMVLSHLLRHARGLQPGSERRGELLDLITRLNDLPTVAKIMRKTAEGSGTDLEALGISFDQGIAEIENVESPDSDEEMVDVDGSNELPNGGPVLPPLHISTDSFLQEEASDNFPSVLEVFETALAYKGHGDRFLETASLGRSQAFQKPLFLSFLIRTWCSSAPASVKVASLRACARSVAEVLRPTDLQHLIPYLIYALSDPSTTVRRAAATCVKAIEEHTSDPGKDAKSRLWASSDLYGKKTKEIAALSFGQTTQIVSSVIVPVLEECVMDANFILLAIRNIIEGPKASKTKTHSAHELKAPERNSFANFLGTHIATTPLLRVRLRLLPIFNFVGKASIGVRSQTILSMTRSWAALSSEDAGQKCLSEELEESDVDKGLLGIVLARDPESLTLLRDVLSGTVGNDRKELRQAAFDRVPAVWPAMKSETRLPLGQCLLDLALRSECVTSVDDMAKTRALETLRAIKLDTAVLVAFLEFVPGSKNMPEGPPAKKRRRSSKNEIIRADLHSSGEINKQLQRLTFVLELIEGSNPGEHTPLFKDLFSVLGDLQQLKQQSGSELVYLQSLVLGALAPIVSELKDQNTASEYEAHVRADLLIDCIRHSSSPQVQNSALLLIASLASWVPELVLHNMMPIFTFIGSTLLRQSDEYSAHVVDQTVSKVVPQLASSLRAKHKDFLVGVADLLLSFAAAFEHIPNHRRQTLFFELANTLGPEDSLSAIVAILCDRYPKSPAQRKFVAELLLRFDPTATLQTFNGYLDLVIDITNPKRKVSDTLFSLNEKKPGQIETAMTNLISGMADLTADRALRAHVAKAFRVKADPAKARAVFGDVIAKVIQLSQKLKKSNPRLVDLCSRLFGNSLDVLPTPDLVASSSALLAKSDEAVHAAVLQAVQTRAASARHHDQRSVEQMLAFLPQVDQLLQQSRVTDVKMLAVSCIDQIVEHFGKKDPSAVAAVAKTISGSQGLLQKNDQVRILSLVCIASMIEVLEEEAISLLPTVLPTAFKYLKESIEEDKPGLHNAVFALFTNVAERLPFMFSREYLEPSLQLSQQSAAADDLDEECDVIRQKFHECVAKNLNPQETFAAAKATWPSAISHGFEATREQIDLIAATINDQPKAEIRKASSLLFSLLLEAFNIRSAAASSDGEEEIDEDEQDQLESTLIEAVIAMTLKLNDTTFRPFFAQLVDQMSASSKRDPSSSVTFYKFLAAFFERFQSIVTSYATYVLEHAASLLATLAKQTSSENNPDNSSELSIALLAALKASFTHDQDTFWQSPSHYETIMPPLLSHLTIPYSTSSISPYLTQHVIPTIVELASSASSSNHHHDLNEILMKEYMKSENAHTRLTSVLCEQALTKRLGEEWLSLLPEMLPSISELREDDDEIVERETQRWISEMERILGEDMEGMLQ